MNWTDFVPPLACGLLGVAALPFAGARRALLAVLSRGTRLGLFALIVACGLCAVLPEAAPDALARLAGTLAPPDWPALGWPVLAGLGVLALLPVLLHLDYARRLPAHSAFLDELRRELHALGRDLAGPGRALVSAAGSAAPHPSEVAAALDALRSLTGTPRRRDAGPPALVLDLHQDPIR